MYIHNGQPFDITLPQLVNDVQYAPGWFFDADQRAANGIVSVADPVAPAVTASQVATLVEFRLMNGVWSPRWQVTDKTPEQLATEVATLKASIDAAVSKCYIDVDGVTQAAVGDRTEEYRVAEGDARAFAAIGYTGEPTLSVSAYAQFNTTGEAQTNQWATDRIIAKADAYRAAQAEMRAKRFEYQAKMRAAESPEGLAVAVAAWDAFIAGTRAALGV